MELQPYWSIVRKHYALNGWSSNLGLGSHVQGDGPQGDVALQTQGESSLNSTLERDKGLLNLCGLFDKDTRQLHFHQIREEDRTRHLHRVIQRVGQATIPTQGNWKDSRC